MSLLLCRQENVRHPYFMEELGIHIYSSQELSYVIYHHPLLVMEGFIDERLLEFMRDELDMGFFALKMEKWQKSGESTDDLLIILLQECGYYKPAEINKFRQQMSSFRKMHRADYDKAKADYLFHLKQYGKAIEQYEKLTEQPKDPFVDDFFLGRIWNNLGSCYARMFRFERSYHSYEMAYHLTKEYTIVQKIYLLTLLDSALVVDNRYLSMIDEETMDKWKGLLQEAENHANEAEGVKELEELFSKDPIKRLAGAGELVFRWKQEYRNML